MALEGRNDRLGSLIIDAAFYEAVAIGAQNTLEPRDGIAPVARFDPAPFEIKRGGANPMSDAGFAQQPPGNFSPGSCFRAGATSECARIRSAPIGPRRVMIDLHKEMTAAICRSGKSGYPNSCPGLTISIPMEHELISASPAQDESPACQARLSSGTHWTMRPFSNTR